MLLVEDQTTRALPPEVPGESLKDRIPRLRRWAGNMSQEELARRAGVSKNQVTGVEQGRIGYLMPDTLAGYVQALGLSETFIVSGRHPINADAQERELEWLDIETFARAKGMTDEQLLAHIRTQFEILLTEDQRRRRLLEDQEGSSM